MNTASIVVSIISLAVGYFLGYWQGKTAQKSYDLSLSKAIPKVGTSVKIDKRQENPGGFPPFCYLVLTIYNDGELPAKQVKGHCRIYSPAKSVEEVDIPFHRDFLGSSPYKLESQRLNNGIGAMPLDVTGTLGQNVRLNVDIDLEYLGIPDGKPQYYSAKYSYDKNSGTMLKVP